MEASTTNGARGVLGRALALLALGVALVAVVIVISGSLGGSSDDSGRETRTEQRQPREKPPETYVVQPGDTLDGIADKTGVPIDRILDLNPDLDPQALPSGAQLELR